VAVAPGQAACGECGRVVPEAETVEIGGRRICASCKPVVVQRMIEGTSSGAATFDPEEMIADLRSRGGYKLDIGSIVSRAWDVVKDNFWPCVGVNGLALIIIFAAGMVPFLSFVATLLLTGPLMGGLHYYYLLQARGQPAVLNDAFVGFSSPLAKELVLAGLVQQLIQFAVILVTIIPAVMIVAAMAPISGAASDPFPVGLVVTIVVMVPVIFVGVFSAYLLWYPAYVMIADTGIGFWKGMELSRRLVMMRFFPWVGMAIVMCLISFAGLLALIVGVLVAIPVVNAMFAIAWNDIRAQTDEVRRARSGQGV
jgi:hypothetical protein